MLSTVNVKLFNNNSKWFKNLTGRDFPEEISNFLSLGPKFTLNATTHDVPIAVLLSQVENIIQALPSDQQDLYRARVTNIITNSYLSNAPRWSRLSALTSLYNKTRIFLKNNPDILITQADKGGTTVALSKDLYVSRSLELLDNNLVYQKLQRDPTITVQNKSNSFVKLLKAKNIIDNDDAKSLMKYNSVPSKFYGLPKIHKSNTPLRPIVSTIGSPTYDLSKFIANILHNALQDCDKYNVADTFTFRRLMENKALPPHYVLISLDVISLFTNIPLNLVVRTIEDAWEHISGYCTIPQKIFLDIIKFIYTNCYFTFQDKFYKQIFGSPMGSPISPILAQLVMDSLLENCIGRLSFRIPFLFKYVDDIICAVPYDKVNEILTIFNGFNPSLQFTVETEVDFGVPFLDTRVIRDPVSNKIVLDWYMKPTASGRYMNFYSNHTINQKVNTLLSMKNRVLYISDPTFVNKNLKNLSDLFENNGYPRSLVKKLIFNTPVSDYATDDGCSVSTCQYKTLPYIDGLSCKLVKVFSNVNFKISVTNKKTIGNIFSNMKDRTKQLLTSDVVYCIPCGNCPMKYYGQTGQWLKSRIALHKSDSKLKTKSCAVSQHMNESGHSMNWEETEIVTVERNYRSRLFLEMYHIRINNSCALNYKSDTNQLSNVYSFLINSNFNLVQGGVRADVGSIET